MGFCFARYLALLVVVGAISAYVSRAYEPWLWGVGAYGLGGQGWVGGSAATGAVSTLLTEVASGGATIRLHSGRVL